jgi:Double zinc ribbon domain
MAHHRARGAMLTSWPPSPLDRAMAGLAGSLDPRRLGAAVLDFLLPPRCLKCGAETGGDGALFTACWRLIAFLGPPCCARCGLLFDVPLGTETICGP